MNSEKQYKHIEDRIMEAAVEADYPFNEASWKKMEGLLDKENEKRRFFFWIFGTLLLGALLLGAGSIYRSVYKNTLPVVVSEHPGNKNEDHQPIQPLSSQEEKAMAGQPVLPGKNTGKTNNLAAMKDINPDKEINTTADDGPASEGVDRPKTRKKIPVAGFNPLLNKNFQNAGPKNNRTVPYADIASSQAGKKNTFKDKNRFLVKVISPVLENDFPIKENTEGTDTGNPETVTKLIQAEPANTSIAKADETGKPDSVSIKANTVAAAKDKKGKKGKSLSGLYILAAVGAEASSTKLLSFKNSSITPGYGVGLGYRFNRRLSLQTGFYAAAKKYIAGPGDYKVKAGSYLSTVKIINVDANCMIYEIPLSVQYNWIIRPKTNYFTSAGISGYIMKKEKYNYTYERYNNIYSYPHDYTKNTHLLAALRLSAGIEKQVGRKLFIQAAPVINIPLQGVGEGQLKLFTTGLQVSLKYLPFKQ